VSPVEGGAHLAARLGVSAADAVLVLTLALVAMTGVYIWLTSRLVADARRQNRPYVYVVPEVDPSRSPPLELRVRNAGNRIAQDVRIIVTSDAMIWTFGRPPRSGTDRPRIERVPVSTLPLVRRGVPFLAPGEARTLGFVPTAHLARGRSQTLSYKITYHDGAGLRYRDACSTEFHAGGEEQAL
jgi:hypothetical protein